MAPPIRACMMGKIGIGKSTLIANLLGVNAKERPEVSASRLEGCTKGIQRYGGDGQKYELYDSEGAFGMFDDFPKLVNQLANEVDGKTLHVMCCCINAEGLTRLDSETLETILMCAGMLGDVGAKNLLLVFTKCDTEAAKTNAMEIFEALKKVAADKRYEELFEGKNTQIAKGVRPLFSQLREDMLGFAMVEAKNVAGVVEALDMFYKKRKEVVMSPSAWVRGKQIWTDVRKGFEMILGMMTTLAPVGARVAGIAGMPRLKTFLELIQAAPALPAPAADAPIMFFPPADMASSAEPYITPLKSKMSRTEEAGSSQKRPCSESQDTGEYVAKKKTRKLKGSLRRKHR